MGTGGRQEARWQELELGGRMGPGPLAGPLPPSSSRPPARGHVGLDIERVGEIHGFVVRVGKIRIAEIFGDFSDLLGDDFRYFRLRDRLFIRLLLKLVVLTFPSGLQSFC